MKIRKTITLSVYSTLHRHRNEIVLAAAFSPPFTFGFSIGEWSWYIGIGHNGMETFYGIFLSYSMPVDRNGIRSAGYFSAAISNGIWWHGS